MFGDCWEFLNNFVNAKFKYPFNWIERMFLPLKMYQFLCYFLFAKILTEVLFLKCWKLYYQSTKGRGYNAKKRLPQTCMFQGHKSQNMECVFFSSSSQVMPSCGWLYCTEDSYQAWNMDVCCSRVNYLSSFLCACVHELLLFIKNWKPQNK